MSSTAARYFLIGFMGVGKTTIGRDLANHLELPFYDLDDEIEKATGRRISEIFAEGSEAEFREIETRVLRQIVGNDSGIIATGGGTFIKPENRAIIRSAGVSIWLDGATDQVIDRGADYDRPLWHDEDQARALLAERLVHYRQADLRFDLKRSSPQEAAKQIAKLLASCNVT